MIYRHPRGSESLTTNDHIGAPPIVLRLPGHWRSPHDLDRRLPEGYRLEPPQLILPDDSGVELHPMPADGDFPEAFEAACGDGLTSRQRRQLRRYTTNACLAGAGGSIEAAKRMTTAASAILRAGAIGVFVDSGLCAHVRDQWLELTEDSCPGDLILALVALAGGADGVHSVGMRSLGCRDAVMSRQAPEALDFSPLIGFLEHLCELDADFVADECFQFEDAAFRIRHDTEPSFLQCSSISNPYGRWRLEPL